jgi:hypothetical protein
MKMKKIIYCIMAAALVVSAGCAKTADGDTLGVIYGVVTDAKTGDFIDNAGVELGIHKFKSANYSANGVLQGTHDYAVIRRTATGSDGHYEFQEVDANVNDEYYDNCNYYVVVSKTDYEQTSYDLSVQAGKIANGDILLRPMSMILTVSTINTTSITATNATFNGNATWISNEYAPKILGFYCSTNAQQLQQGINVVCSSSSYFSVYVDNLTPNTTYYVQAYATNNIGTVLSDNVSSFQTTNK